MLIDQYGYPLHRSTDRCDDGRTSSQRARQERGRSRDRVCSPEQFDQVVDAGKYYAFCLKKGVSTSNARERIAILRLEMTGE